MRGMKKTLIFWAPVTLVSALLLSGCSGNSDSGTPAAQPASSSSTEVQVDAPEEAAPAGDSFADGVLTTKDVKITITDYKVIPVGEAGNEYGSSPVIAIWYDTTNLGAADRDITPSEFIFMFEAFQDNDPNRENKLQVGMLPDSAFLETQTAKIKEGGTVPSAIAYELDDTTTPVDLVAGRFGDEIGRMTINLG